MDYILVHIPLFHDEVSGSAMSKKFLCQEETLQRLSRLRTRSQNFGDTLGSDSPQEVPEAKEAQATVP